MSYGRVRAESTIREGRDYASLHGEGSARSNDYETARSLSSSLGSTVRNTNEMAYDAHVRSKGW